jgi:hypothetical protein
MKGGCFLFLFFIFAAIERASCWMNGWMDLHSLGKIFDEFDV